MFHGIKQSDSSGGGGGGFTLLEAACSRRLRGIETRRLWAASHNSAIITCSRRRRRGRGDPVSFLHTGCVPIDVCTSSMLATRRVNFKSSWSAHLPSPTLSHSRVLLTTKKMQLNVLASFFFFFFLLLLLLFAVSIRQRVKRLSFSWRKLLNWNVWSVFPL